jgi:DNA-directed RNA polymerase specialized sigma24 family protein
VINPCPAKHRPLTQRILDARTCRKPARACSLALVPPMVNCLPALSAPIPRARVLALVARQARVVAERLGATPTTVEIQTLELCNDPSKGLPSTAFKIRAWGSREALRIAASEVVYTRARLASLRENRAARIGVSPEDIAQDVVERFLDTPPKEPWVKPVLLAWAGKTAVRRLVDNARHEDVVANHERQVVAGQDPVVQGAAPANALELAVVSQDRKRIQDRLGKPSSRLAKLFRLLQECPDATSRELAEKLGIRPAYVQRLKNRLRRKVKEISRLGLIDLQPKRPGNGLQP